MNVFLDPLFISHYEREIGGQTWRVLDPALLLDTLDADARSQPQHLSAGLKRRRAQLMPWLTHGDRWGKLVLGATLEEGPSQGVLRGLGVLEVFEDFVDHLKCFYAVADSMKRLGHVVIPVDGDETFPAVKPLILKDDVVETYPGSVHDLDKLDPVMLAGYAERFTDGACTSLWSACVDGHVRRNAHHQGHALWQHRLDVGDDVREPALREMLCDKVSRRVQKDLGGVLCPEMWDVDVAFFEGLPDVWMDCVTRMVGVVKGAYGVGRDA